MLFWNSLAFSMIQWMLKIWSLVLLLFLKPAWTSGSSRFTYCWSLAWIILSITLLACEMSAIVRQFEHCLTLPFFGIGMKHDHFSPVATAEFSKFAGILSATLSQHHLTVSHRFWVVVFSLSFILMHILISFFIPSVICWLFSSVLFSHHMFVFLIVFFFSCSWHLISPHCDQKKYLRWFQQFWIYQG